MATVLHSPLTNLGRVAPLAGALVPNSLLDAVHLLLVAALVFHGALLGLLQCTLQGLNSLSRSPKSFFQFRKLTTQICIVTYQLQGEPKGRGGGRGERPKTEPAVECGVPVGRKNKEKSSQRRQRPCCFLESLIPFTKPAVLASSFFSLSKRWSGIIKSHTVFWAVKRANSTVAQNSYYSALSQSPPGLDQPRPISYSLCQTNSPKATMGMRCPHSRDGFMGMHRAGQQEHSGSSEGGYGVESR